MAIICVTRYHIDPFQKDAFKKYAKNWVASFPSATAIWSDSFFLMKAEAT